MINGGQKLSPQEMIERVEEGNKSSVAMRQGARALAQEGRAQEVSALRASIAIARGKSA